MWYGGENAIPFQTQHDAALGEGNVTLLMNACLSWVDAQLNKLTSALRAFKNHGQLGLPANS